MIRIATAPAVMPTRPAFGIASTIDFDCYLVDEVTGGGDVRFRSKSEPVLMERRDRAALVVILHDRGALEQYCGKGAVLYGEILTFSDSMLDA